MRLCLCHTVQPCDDPMILDNINAVEEVYMEFLVAGIKDFHSRYGNKGVEYGAVLRMGDNGEPIIDDVVTNNQPDRVSIDIGPGDKSTIHTHTNNNPPSMMDVIGLARSVSKTMRTSFICTPDGSYFALVVERKAWAEAFLSNNQTDTKLNAELQLVMDSLFQQTSGSLNDRELRLYATAYLLSKHGSGIQLMKLNFGPGGGWVQISMTKDATGIYQMRQCKK